MKFSVDVLIRANVQQVWAAFDDADSMHRWQQNFHAYNPISGKPGEVGAVAQLTFDEDGRKVRLTETITERRDRSFFAATYVSDHGTALIVNRFEAVDDDSTRWTSWVNFRFSGIRKLLSIFAAGVVKQRRDGDMQRFKLMVESDLVESRA